MSAPWWHPEANPLEDIRAVMRKFEQQYRSSFGIPPAVVGPEPGRCPSCGMTRLECAQFWGSDPGHRRDIEAAVRNWETP
jgi:hypothetical protein